MRWGMFLILCLLATSYAYGAAPLNSKDAQASIASGGATNAAPYYAEADTPFNLNYIGSNVTDDGLIFEFNLRVDFDSDDWLVEDEECWSMDDGCCLAYGRLTLQLAHGCAGDALREVYLDGRPIRSEVTRGHVTIWGLTFWGTTQKEITNQIVTLAVDPFKGKCPPKQEEVEEGGGQDESGAENREGEGSPCPPKGTGRGGCMYKFEALDHRGNTMCEMEGNSYPWTWQPGHLFTRDSARVMRCPYTASVTEDNSAVRFYTFGDWGAEYDPITNIIDDYGSQGRVAIAMHEQARWFKPQFVLSLGDNFYEFGLTSPKDPAKKRVWADVWTTFDNLKDLKWYATLGNHDYGPTKGPVVPGAKAEHCFNATAEPHISCLASGKSKEQCAEENMLEFYSPRWQYTDQFGMPDKWKLENGTYKVTLTEDVELFVIDTTPIRVLGIHGNANGYTDNVPHGLTVQRPDLAMAQLDQMLTESKAKWKIVAGHDGWEGFGKHGKKNFNKGLFADSLEPLMKKHNIRLYLHAHDHIMQVVKDMHGPTTHITAGSVYRQRSAVGKGVVAKNNHVYERLWYSVDPGELLKTEEPFTDAGYASVVVQGDKLIYSMWTIRGGCNYENVIDLHKW